MQISKEVEWKKVLQPSRFSAMLCLYCPFFKHFVKISTLQNCKNQPLKKSREEKEYHKVRKHPPTCICIGANITRGCSHHSFPGEGESGHGVTVPLAAVCDRNSFSFDTPFSTVSLQHCSCCWS